MDGNQSLTLKPALHQPTIRRRRVGDGLATSGQELVTDGFIQKLLVEHRLYGSATVGDCRRPSATVSQPN